MRRLVFLTPILVTLLACSDEDPFDYDAEVTDLVLGTAPDVFDRRSRTSE